MDKLGITFLEHVFHFCETADIIKWNIKQAKNHCGFVDKTVDNLGGNMNITIIGVGKLKEKYLKDGIAEYAKRMKSYAPVEIVEVPDEPAANELSDAEVLQVKEKEGDRILEKIPERAHVIALDLRGKQFTSEQFSAHIEEEMTYGSSHFVFIIGGSHGLSQSVLQRVDTKICFGKMTYPHQLMRLILIEQIYRAFRIMRNEPYHK